MRGLGNLDSLGTEMSFSESARRGKIQKKLIFDLKIKKKCKPVTTAEQEFQQIVTKTKYLKKFSFELIFWQKVPKLRLYFDFDIMFFLSQFWIRTCTSYVGM